MDVFFFEEPGIRQAAKVAAKASGLSYKNSLRDEARKRGFPSWESLRQNVIGPEDPRALVALFEAFHTPLSSLQKNERPVEPEVFLRSDARCLGPALASAVAELTARGPWYAKVELSNRPSKIEQAATVDTSANQAKELKFMNDELKSELAEIQEMVDDLVDGQDEAEFNHLKSETPETGQALDIANKALAIGQEAQQEAQRVKAGLQATISDPNVSHEAIVKATRTALSRVKDLTEEVIHAPVTAQTEIEELDGINAESSEWSDPENPYGFD